MKFLFILYYIILPIIARIEVFDNTLHPDNLTITPNNSSCVFQSSNHFVLKTVDASAKMYLTSTLPPGPGGSLVWGWKVDSKFSQIKKLSIMLQ